MFDSIRLSCVYISVLSCTVYVSFGFLNKVYSCDLNNAYISHQALPELKEVVKVIEDMSKVTIPNTNALLVNSFMDSIDAYYEGVFPERYQEVIKRPMCIGTVLSNTVECVYGSVRECRDDFNLIAANCELYYQALAEWRGGELSAVEIDLITTAKAVVERFTSGLETELLKRLAACLCRLPFVMYAHYCRCSYVFRFVHESPI